MLDLNKRVPEAIRVTHELVCVDCRGHFIFGRYEQEHFTRMGWSVPKRCPSCRKEAKVRRAKETEQIENEIWQQKSGSFLCRYSNCNNMKIYERAK